MFYKKKFDYTDRNNFKLVVCDEGYYENKFKGGLPPGYCKLLEILSLKEYNEKDIDNVIEIIKLENLKLAAQINKEFEKAAGFALEKQN